MEKNGVEGGKRKGEVNTEDQMMEPEKPLVLSLRWRPLDISDSDMRGHVLYTQG